MNFVPTLLKGYSPKPLSLSDPLIKNRFDCFEFVFVDVVFAKLQRDDRFVSLQGDPQALARGAYFIARDIQSLKSAARIISPEKASL